MERKIAMNPWLSIWTRPKETIRAIVDADPSYRFGWLAAIYGFSLLLEAAQNFSLGDVLSPMMIVFFALILSVFVGMLAITVVSGLLFWTGRWVGGKATYKEIRSAVAWSNITNVVSIISWFIMLCVFGRQVFFSTFPQTTFAGYELGVVLILFLAQVIVGIWSIVIIINAIAEVQRFSVWRALLNVIIPLVLIFIFTWIVGSIVIWSVKVS